MSILPSDINKRVLSYLDPLSMSHAARVCKQWNQDIKACVQAELQAYAATINTMATVLEANASNNIFYYRNILWIKNYNELQDAPSKLLKQIKDDKTNSIDSDGEDVEDSVYLHKEPCMQLFAATCAKAVLAKKPTLAEFFRDQFPLMSWVFRKTIGFEEIFIQADSRFDYALSLRITFGEWENISSIIENPLVVQNSDLQMRILNRAIEREDQGIALKVIQKYQSLDSNPIIYSLIYKAPTDQQNWELSKEALSFISFKTSFDLCRLMQLAYKDCQWDMVNFFLFEKKIDIQALPFYYVFFELLRTAVEHKQVEIVKTILPCRMTILSEKMGEILKIAHESGQQEIVHAILSSHHPIDEETLIKLGYSREK